jgi:hypothetical protein
MATNTLCRHFRRHARWRLQASEMPKLVKGLADLGFAVELKPLTA